MSTGETEEAVVAELVASINETTATTAFAGIGLGLLHDQTLSLTPLPENPDPVTLVGRGDPNDPSTRPIAYWPRSELLRQTQRVVGDAHAELHRQWVVTTFANWDENFRPRLAAARGVKPNEVIVPAFGDLRLIRNDIVHNKAIASTSSRAQVLQWFAAGDSIHLATEHLQEFLAALPWQVVPYSL